MANHWTIFLDRDGVFDVLKLPGVVRMKDWEWLPGVHEAFARLNRSDIQTCLCTNQPRVGHLMATPGMVRRMNRYLKQELEAAGGRMDNMEAAYSPVWLKHRRRKPRPGMLEDGAAKLPRPVDPVRSVMIGDTLKDAQAGEAFGARTILLATTHDEPWLREQAASKGVRVDAFCRDLPHAVDVVLGWIDG